MKHLARTMLLAAIALAPLVVCAQSPTPWAEWRFDAERVREKNVDAVHGADLVAEATLQLSKEKPTSLVLSGAKNFLGIGNDPLQAKLPTKSLAIETWLRFDRTSEWGGVVGAIQDNGAYERGWVLGCRNTKFMFAVASESKKRLTYLLSDQDIALNSWYYVAATYDGETMRLFIDGELAAESKEQSGDILYPPKCPIGVGAYRDDNENYPFAGRIESVVVHAQTLTAEHVRQQFANRKGDFPNIEASETRVAGWPTYMHDKSRSGITHEDVPTTLQQQWVYRATLPPNPAWPPPAKQNFWRGQTDLPARVVYDRAMQVVSDGKHVVFGSSADDTVVCLRIDTGEVRWRYTADGPVRLAPTLHDDRVYFGSDDGHVVCLQLNDGKRVWRFRAGPSDRRIPGNGRIISTWPIRSGVIVANGQARFAAGLFPNQGTFQYALDAKTGKELASGKLSFSPQGYMQLRGSALMVGQGRAKTAMMATVDATAKSKVSNARKVSEDFPYAWIGTPKLWIGGGDDRVAAFSKSGERVWDGAVKGRAYGLAIAGERLLVTTDQGNVVCFGKNEAVARATSNDTPPPATLPDDDWPTTATKRIVDLTQPNGFALLDRSCINVARGKAWGAMHAVVLADTEEEADVLRRHVSAASLTERVRIHTTARESLPYGPAIFNVVAVRLTKSEVNRARIVDLVRVTRPSGGTLFVNCPDTEARDAAARLIKEHIDAALIGVPESIDDTCLAVVRKRLPGTGEWTHLYANPSNTSCSEDEQVDEALELQWFGAPGPREMLDRHHRTIAPLYCGSRLFIPGNNRIYGVDAYNGALLWEREVPDSRRVGVSRDAGSMATTEDLLYIASASSCLALDTQTGYERLRLSIPIVDDGKKSATDSDWGAVIPIGDVLIGTSTRPGASRDGHSRQQISETYYDGVPLVTSNGLFGLNRKSGAGRWRYDPTDGAIINSTLTIGGGMMMFIESRQSRTLDEPSGRSKLRELVGTEAGAVIVALNIDDGSEQWRVPVDLRAVEHQLFMSYTDDKLIIVGTKNKKSGTRTTCWFDTHCHSAKDGKELWTATQDQGQGTNGDHGEQDRHPAIVGETLYVEPYAYDINTGKRREAWNLARGGHGCGSLSASAKTCFFRAGNPTMCNLETGAKTKVTRVSRPGCWINIIPAGGMVLIPEASSGCVCDFPIQTSLSFGSRALRLK